MGIFDSTATGAATGAAAGGPWGALIGAGIGLFGSLFGANEQASAQTDAANINANAQEQIAQMNTAAQKYAADLQSKAAGASLDFSKAGAENAFQNNEVSRAGNYDQWAAAQARIGSISKLLGMSDRVIPTYRPGVDPGFTGSGGASSTPVAVTPDITAAAMANYKTLGVSPSGAGSGPTDIAYYAQKIAETGGLTPANTAYWFGPNGRIAQDLAKAGGGAPPPAATVNPYSVSQYLG